MQVWMDACYGGRGRNSDGCWWWHGRVEEMRTVYGRGDAHCLWLRRCTLSMVEEMRTVYGRGDAHCLWLRRCTLSMVEEMRTVYG